VASIFPRHPFSCQSRCAYSRGPCLAFGQYCTHPRARLTTASPPGSFDRPVAGAVLGEAGALSAGGSPALSQPRNEAPHAFRGFVAGRAGKHISQPSRTVQAPNLLYEESTSRDSRGTGGKVREFFWLRAARHQSLICRRSRTGKSNRARSELPMARKSSVNQFQSSSSPSRMR